MDIQSPEEDGEEQTNAKNMSFSQREEATLNEKAARILNRKRKHKRHHFRDTVMRIMHSPDQEAALNFWEDFPVLDQVPSTPKIRMILIIGGAFTPPSWAPILQFIHKAVTNILALAPVVAAALMYAFGDLEQWIALVYGLAFVFCFLSFHQMRSYIASGHMKKITLMSFEGVFGIRHKNLSLSAAEKTFRFYYRLLAVSCIGMCLFWDGVIVAQRVLLIDQPHNYGALYLWYLNFRWFFESWSIVVFMSCMILFNMVNGLHSLALRHFREFALAVCDSRSTNAGNLHSLQTALLNRTLSRHSDNDYDSRSSHSLATRSQLSSINHNPALGRPREHRANTGSTVHKASTSTHLQIPGQPYRPLPPNTVPTPPLDSDNCDVSVDIPMPNQITAQQSYPALSGTVKRANDAWLNDTTVRKRSPSDALVRTRDASNGSSMGLTEASSLPRNLARSLSDNQKGEAESPTPDGQWAADLERGEEPRRITKSPSVGSDLALGSEAGTWTFMSSSDQREDLNPFELPELVNCLIDEYNALGRDLHAICHRWSLYWGVSLAVFVTGVIYTGYNVLIVGKTTWPSILDTGMVFAFPVGCAFGLWNVFRGSSAVSQAYQDLVDSINSQTTLPLDLTVRIVQFLTVKDNGFKVFGIRINNGALARTLYILFVGCMILMGGSYFEGPSG